MALGTVGRAPHSRLTALGYRSRPEDRWKLRAGRPREVRRSRGGTARGRDRDLGGRPLAARSHRRRGAAAGPLAHPRHSAPRRRRDLRRFPRRNRRVHRSGRSPGDERAGGNPRGLGDPLRRRLRRRRALARSGGEARRPGPGGVLCADRRSLVADDRQRRHRGHRRRDLARRDDERIQPPRQHGRPRRDARHNRGGVLRSGRRNAASEPRRARAGALARRRMPRLPSVQPPTARKRVGVHGRLRQPGARLHARCARPRFELEGGRNDGRDARASDSRAGGPDSRHDARHDRAATRRPPDLSRRA